MPILESLGFDYKRAGSVELGGWRWFDKRDRYGAPLISHSPWNSAPNYVFVMRLAMALAGDFGLDASAVPVTTSWNNCAVDLDGEAEKTMLEAQ
ncbi:hypothetical protein F5Y12DRAFT_719171 [Xylaria sp. FL1777]|nr:hypothetical protein F5Y12DRAFT_719171 [Xylaria sp. FL1777]